MKLKKRKTLLFISLVTFVFLFCANSDIKAQVPVGENLDFSFGNYTHWRDSIGNYGYNYGSESLIDDISAPYYHWNAAHEDPGSVADPDVTSNPNQYLFEIYSDTSEYDPHTGNRLKKVPSHLGYLHSSRINHGDHTGYGDHTCSMLKYTMDVNSNNCLLNCNYAMILRDFGHTGYQNPTFQIDIKRHDPSNPSLILGLVDSCAFFEQIGSGSRVDDSIWFSQPDLSYFFPWVWCQWQQIKINLARYVGDRITISVRISDCVMAVDAGYGYVVFSAERPNIQVAGCEGNGDTVTLAHAPKAFDSYKWFKIPSLTSNQQTLENISDTATVIGTDSVLVVTNDMMSGESSQYFAVELISPRTQTTRPHCIAYISTTVNDARPQLDNFSYIPIDVENPNNEIGIKFAEVQPASSSYYLGWQKIDFGDGDSVTFTLNENVEPKIWEQTSVLSNRTRIVRTNGDVDTIYHTYENNGTYSLTRCAQTSINAECDSCRRCRTIDVIVPERPNLAFSFKDTICQTETDTITAYSPNNIDTTHFIYKWWKSNQSYDETPIFIGKRFIVSNIISDTTFKVRVVDTVSSFYRNGSVTIHTTSFPDVTIQGDTIICINQAANLTAINNNTQSLTFQWSFTQPTSSTIMTNPTTNPSLSFTPTKDTTVYLLTQTSNGCLAWKSVHIHIVNPLITASKQEICLGDSVVLTGSNAVDYSWTASPTDESLIQDVRSVDPVIVKPQQTTTYTMSGYGSNGCSSNKQITITVYPFPQATISYSPSFVDQDSPVVSFQDVSPYGVSSLWYFSDGAFSTNRTLNYRFNDLTNDSVWIKLISYNHLGCSDSTIISLPIELFAVWLPNAFTPNNQSNNNRFFFLTNNVLDNVHLSIFNRWGEKVYDYSSKRYDPNDNESSNLGWNGKYKGKDVEQGTYVWRLSYSREDDGRVIDRHGTVLILR
jgi:gliding motility-associated-like protein